MEKLLLIFDIDGTICDFPGKPSPEQMVKILRKLGLKHRLAIASGKPFIYISGLCRQIEIPEAAVIGENGGTISENAKFPPEGFEAADVPEDTLKLISLIKKEFTEKFGSKMWIQPGYVNVTFFPSDVKNMEELHSFARTFADDRLNIYHHHDCVDFTPKGVSKGYGVEKLFSLTGIPRSDCWVFGDGANDFEMFETAGHSVCVGHNDKLRSIAEYAVEDIPALADFLKRFL
jgi:HAD superfamily hydrolase (TIGR01484 family)